MIGKRIMYTAQLEDRQRNTWICDQQERVLETQCG